MSNPSSPIALDSQEPDLAQPISQDVQSCSITDVTEEANNKEEEQAVNVKIEEPEPIKDKDDDKHVDETVQDKICEETKLDSDEKVAEIPKDETVTNEKPESVTVVSESQVGDVTSTTGAGTNKSNRRNNRPLKSQNSYRSSRPKPNYTRRFVGYYQVQNSYGIKSPPYKSNFEPSETARQKADEFLKVIRQQ